MMLVQGVCSPNSWQVVLLDWPSAEDRFKGQISHISCKPLCVFCLLYLWHRHKRSSCHAAAQGTAIHRACSMKGVTTLTGHNLQLRAAMIAIVYLNSLAFQGLSAGVLRFGRTHFAREIHALKVVALITGGVGAAPSHTEAMYCALQHVVMHRRSNAWPPIACTCFQGHSHVTHIESTAATVCGVHLACMVEVHHACWSNPVPQASTLHPNLVTEHVATHK